MLCRMYDQSNYVDSVDGDECNESYFFIDHSINYI